MAFNSAYICSGTVDCYAKTYADKNSIEFKLCDGHGVESAKKITDYNKGDIIKFGWYPQSEVMDADTIAALNAADGEWVSYGYYSGTGTWSDGQMTAKDYMRYKDVMYGLDKYRGVVFDTYRPYYTGFEATNSSNSFQDDNGYTTGTVYWFKYEPVEWRVLDPSTGLVMSEAVIDTQPFNNYVLKSGTDAYGQNAYWGDSSKTYYANNYTKSSIRKWLNDVFYNVAFSNAQQDIIEYTYLDNSAYMVSASIYGSKTTNDKIYLLSYNDALNTDYGFSSGTSNSLTRCAESTAYAKAQGVYVDSYGISLWLLRTPGGSSDYSCHVNSDGYVDNYCSVSYGSGVRPAFNFNLNSEILQSEKPENITLMKIEVRTLPTKSEYYVGDTLDTTGLTLTATYNNGTTETITSGFTCSPTKLTTAGKQTITVTYGGKTCTFDVEVEPADEIVSGQCGDNLTWTLNITKGILNITGTGAMWNWTSGSYAPWYDYRSSIKMVNIADGVTTIGNYAFCACDNLKTLIIPESLTRIGYFAFFECKSLISVTFPEGLITIGQAAFAYCSELVDIDIPDNVTGIGLEAFFRCVKLERVIIGKKVRGIGSDAFGDCTSLTSINIPSSVNLIGTYTQYEYTLNAFRGCRSLTNITVDENNENYSSDEYGVLFNKDKTRLIQYPIGNTRVSYTIPDSVTRISSGAFSHSEYLTSVFISEISDLTFVSDYAFSYCSNLKYVHIPASVTSIGSGILDGTFAYICSVTENCYAKSYADENGIEFKLCNGNCAERSLAKIEVKILPVKTEYLVGDTLDTTGLTLTATYNNGTTQTITTGFTCSPTKLNTAGKQTITVTYGGKTCTFNVTVKAVELVKIEINTMPIKTEYFVGDTLNTTGLTLTATYNNGTTETITSGFTCSPTKLTTAGKQTITVTYGGKTCTFDVTVNEKPISNDYSVTYMVSGKRYAKYIVTVGDPVPAPAVNPIVDGMIFEGWSPEIVSIMPEKDLVYTAVFHVHSYDDRIAINPTCTQHGVMNYICSCGDSYTEIIPALGHSWGNWITVIEATANSNGQKVRYCSRCGEAEYEVIPAPSANFRVEPIADQEYTGFGLYPAVKVYSLSGQRLDEYDHYEVTYKNNIECGVATATVTGVGEYSGAIEVNFNIVKKDIANLSFAEIPDVTYSGDAYTPDPVIYYGDILLVKDVDYTVSYSANINIGKATITITGIGNYTGTKIIYFNISKNETSFSIPVIGSQVYTGKAVTPDFNLFSGDKLLIKDVDYTVTYENNINVGYGRIIINGIGNYSGTIVVIFRITSVNISLVTVPNFDDVVYDGNEFTPDFSKNPIIFGDKELTEGVDYKVEIYNNRNAGTVKIVIIGIGNFTGTIVIYVNITAVNISGAAVSAIGDVEYNGYAQTPAFTVTINGKRLVKGVDYTVEYRNNVYAGTATVVIKGIGNYKGEKSFTFRIVESTYYELVVTTDSETLGYDSTMQVYAEVNPYIDGAYTFIYSSSNSNIASVNEYGVVKALDEGEVVITVTVVDENGNPVLNPDGEEIRSEIRIRCTMTFWQKIIKFFRSIAAFFTNLFTFSIGLQMN